MPFVIFISGVPNAGKSTIAAGLACTIPNTEFIDGDFVLSEEEEAQFKGESSPEKWAFHLERIGHIINEKLSLNRNVSVAWPLLQVGHNYLVKHLPKDTKLYCVFLNPDITQLMQSRTTRPLTKWDHTRGIEMHQEKYHTQEFLNLVLDTTELLPFDTTNTIRVSLGL
jgi:shikimate kinase